MPAIMIRGGVRPPCLSLSTTTSRDVFWQPGFGQFLLQPDQVEREIEHAGHAAGVVAHRLGEDDDGFVDDAAHHHVADDQVFRLQRLLEPVSVG